MSYGFYNADNSSGSGLNIIQVVISYVSEYLIKKLLSAGKYTILTPNKNMGKSKCKYITGHGRKVLTLTIHFILDEACE